MKKKRLGGCPGINHAVGIAEMLTCKKDLRLLPNASFPLPHSYPSP